jgi:hypothetical protein
MERGGGIKIQHLSGFKNLTGVGPPFGQFNNPNIVDFFYFPQILIPFGLPIP